ncbi:DUF4124 domain-containing protein [Mitsuaria sp. WAJ17]|uniref:DUF4124 domain-containing protein n=1 Tax=Mitsuaria sp. WAJ17 TaxID=2761452 RepID=UPI001602E497|nr:DUF4124 domain-containing protein [Mitsuaria sp. WAJ17]MBB2487779.1 DUF4124 domain-containing protein [Mitsuaria sp. WAJ17]
MLLHSLLLRPRRLTLVLLLGAVASLPAAAQVFKCTDSSGKTTYQSQPCPDSTKSAELDLRWTSSALPGLTSSANFSGNVTMGELRQALVSGCTGSVNTRGDAALRRLAATQPGKFRDFCECVADASLSDFDRVKRMALSNDRAGLEQLGLRAGLSCAPRLR